MVAMLKGVACGVALLVSVQALASPVDGHSTVDANNVDALRAQIRSLDARNKQQAQLLDAMEQRLDTLEKHLNGQTLDGKTLGGLRGCGEPSSNAYRQAVRQKQGAGRQSSHSVKPSVGPPARQRSSRPSTSPTSGSKNTAKQGQIGEKPQPSRTAKAIQQQAQGTSFTQSFTLEPGFSYSHSDQRQLSLSGFLALDAIFLGSIAVEETKSDNLQFDLTARWGITPELQLYVDAPFLYRRVDFYSGGAGQSAAALRKHSLHESPHIGDVSLGGYYQLWAETPQRPNLVANLELQLPTGRSPYGIKTIKLPSKDNFQVPKELPTGNGVYSVLAGLSVLKTVDPVILFANMGMRHYFKRSFSDIGSQEGVKQPGDVDLGNAYQWGAGVAVALNEKMALSFAFSQLIQEAAKTRQKGGDWHKIIGSRGESAQLSMGLTYAISKHVVLMPSLALGLTQDSPDFQVSVRFPYTF